MEPEAGVDINQTRLYEMAAEPPSSNTMRRKALVLGLVAVLFGLGLAGLAGAQDTDRDAAIMAFREQRFEDAVRLFERAIAADPNDSESHFLLARVYYETPLRDRRKAQRALDRAIALEPENVQYLVARLIQLREESWNFIVDKIREAKRRTLAQEILALDPENAFAHEEMGVGYIRDFWRYRNAIMMPGFDLAKRWRVPGPAIDDEFVLPTDLATDPNANPDFDPSAPIDFENPFSVNQVLTLGQEVIPELDDPSELFLADEFDIERLERYGVPVRDLTQRASRVYNRAVLHLQAALKANPRQRSVYDQLIKVYALRGEYDEALRTLQQMYVFFPDDPGMWMFLGLANYRGGNPEAGAKSFERAIELAPEDVQRVFNDIRFIVPVDERQQYDEDPVGYTSKFWTSKDPRYLTPYNERKVEHYARLVYADLLYGVPQVNRRGWDTERGQILIRYGLPKSDVVIIPDRNIDDTGPDRMAPVNDPLAEPMQSPNELKGFEVLNTYNIWDYGDFRFVFEDPFRTGEYRLYSPSAEALSQRALPWQNDYVIAAAETIRKTPETYTYEAPGRQIVLPYLVNAFKSASGGADVYVHYGIPVTNFDRSNEFVQVTAKEGTFVVGDDRQIQVEQRRTIYGLQTAQIQDFNEQSLWVNTQSLKTGAGRKEVSVELELSEGAAVAGQRRTIDVPDFEGDQLRMSDVMLAYGVEETFDAKPLASGEVVRRNYSIRPAPWSVFSLSQPIYLYFEFYNLNLTDGVSSYEIEGRLEKKDDAKGVRRVVRGIFGGDNASVSVRQPGTGSSADEGQYLIMDASDVEPGLYTLVVIVTDVRTGKSVERSKDLFLE